MSTGNPLPGTRVRIPLTDRPGDHAVVRVIAAPRRDLARAGRLSEALRPFAEALLVDLAGPATYVVDGDDLTRLAAGWRLVAMGDASGGHGWIGPSAE